MVISFGQKFKIFFVKLVVDFLWFVDTFTLLQLNNIYLLIKASFCLVLVFYGVSFINLLKLGVIQKNVGYFSDGLLASVNYKSTPELLFTSQVLGTSTDNSSKSDIDHNLPYLVGNLLQPVISAKSSVVVDVGSNRRLYESLVDERLAPASTTKLMTALVSLDIYNLDDYVEVPYFCTTVDTQKAGLPEGESFMVRDLLYSLLVSSAGDAACVLAVGKVSYADFVSLMNQKAMELKMENTKFTNPIGLDGVGGGHYSTAWDLYKLARVSMINDLLRDIVDTQEFILRSKSGVFSIKLANTNKLLWEVPGSVGIKTGRTQGAGEVLIYEYKKDLVDLIIVVMGSSDRFVDTQLLLNWTLSQYTWANRI